MKLAIFPGNSKSNKEWVDKIGSIFSEPFTIILKYKYSHWDKDEDLINLDTELAQIEPHDLDDYILAKSAGSMLVVYGNYLKRIFPKKCIFVGLPLRWAEKQGFDLGGWLKEFSVPTLILQNSNDPITSYNEVLAYLTKINNPAIQLIKLSGDDHKYDDFEKIKKIALEFFS